MKELFSVFIMAAVQGVAEFLPISSSGHLLVLGNGLGFDAQCNKTLNIVLHAGTLLAIVVYYFRKLLSILLDAQRRRLILMVIAGTVPTALWGGWLYISGWDKKLFSSPWVAVGGFFLTGTLLLLVFGLPWKKNIAGSSEDGIAAEKMTLWQAFLIGCAQAFAITPGISRSGSTISAGLIAKLRKTDAAEFSFLLAIPAIGGAAFLELKSLLLDRSAAASSSQWGIYALGFIVAAVVGYASLAGLIAILRRGRLGWFAFYLYTVSLIVAGWQIYKLF